MSTADVICLMFCAFRWGSWWGAGRAKKASVDDPCFKIIYSMVQQIRAKRKFVGPSLVLWVEEHFELFGEHWSIAVKADAHHERLAG
jgi:hypothetical protein